MEVPANKTQTDYLDSLDWRSGPCESHQCAEVAMTSDGVYMDDTKLPDHESALRFSPVAWQTFMGRIMRGEFGPLSMD